ncbi:hypothetical protein [uncultured Flavobacterium sp.]|uniref:hypothetical protein n=1 Tax=uncultured Flavobacterium sp. TaxID=165435 RepID=UPI00259348FF|nr:hypothetical protein [uncultured Flavobacterium sp.]
MEYFILNQFCIGEEFTLHEFELEYIETKTDKNGIDYDYFRCIGKIELQNIKQLVLVYNCDVLRGVFATLER